MKEKNYRLTISRIVVFAGDVSVLGEENFAFRPAKEVFFGIF